MRKLRIGAAATGMAAFAALFAVAGAEAGHTTHHASHARHAAKATRINVTAGKPSEFSFTLSKKTVPTGKVTFKVVNKGAIPHDFKICSSSKGGTANACKGKVTKLINPKKSATLTYTFAKKGTYEYLCTVPGHAAGGMKGDLKVK